MTLRKLREATRVGCAVDRRPGRRRLGTSARFVRRLIAERRIAYVKLGRHVRIAADDLEAFIAAGRVEGGGRKAVS